MQPGDGGVIRPDRASLVLLRGHGAHGGQQIPAAVLGLHGKFVRRKGVLNRFVRGFRCTRGFGLQADGAGSLRDQADGLGIICQQRCQLILQGFERGCLVVGFGNIPSVDQGHHSIVVVLIFKQIAGDIVGAAAIHGKLHLQLVQKFVQRGGGVGKLYCAYCGRGFAGHHDKLAAGYTVRAFQHGAAANRHSDHAQTQRFALVFFQVDGQAGVLGSTRPCFGGLPVAAAVLVLCQQLVVVQCAVGDARPCDLIRQGFGVGAVGQQNAVGRAGLGQAGANVRILLGCRCAHGVGAACFGYAGNRKAHGGKVPIRRAVGELIHLHGQRGLRAFRFQGCRARGQVDFHLFVCIGYAVQLVGVIGSTCDVIPSKGIEQIVFVIQRAGCVRAQGRGGQNVQGDRCGFGAGVGFIRLHKAPQRAKRIPHIAYFTVLCHLAHILHGVCLYIAIPLCVGGLRHTELPAADGIAHARVDGGCQNAQVGKIGQGGIGQIAEGHVRGRAGQNRFDRLQGDILPLQVFTVYCSNILLAYALQHNAVLGVDRLPGNFYVCRNGKVVGAGACCRDICNGQFTQTAVVIARQVGHNIVLGGLHPFSRVIGFYRGAHGNRAAFIRPISGTVQPEQIALGAFLTVVAIAADFVLRKVFLNSAAIHRQCPALGHVFIVVHVFQNDIHAVIKAQQLDLRGRQGLGKGEGVFRITAGWFALLRVAGRDFHNVLFAQPSLGGFKGVLVGVDRGGGQIGHFLISFTLPHHDRHLIVRCARYGFPCNTVAPVDGGSAAGIIASDRVDAGNLGFCHIVIRVQHRGVILAHCGVVDVLFAGAAITAPFGKGKHQLALLAVVVFAYNGILGSVNFAVCRVDLLQIGGRTRHKRRVFGGYLRGKVVSASDASGIQAVTVDFAAVRTRRVVVICCILLRGTAKSVLSQPLQPSHPVAAFVVGKAVLVHIEVRQHGVVLSVGLYILAAGVAGNGIIITICVVQDKAGRNGGCARGVITVTVARNTDFTVRAAVGFYPSAVVAAAVNIDIYVAQRLIGTRTCQPRNHTRSL